MAVDVNEKDFFVFSLSYRLLHVVNLLMSLFVWVFPLSVQIVPRKRRSVVAVDDSIRIQHGEYFDYELVSHFLSVRVGST